MLTPWEGLQDSFKGIVDKQDDPEDGDELQPPKNFAMVYRGVYRSAYPTKKNFAFLKKLGLRSVIYLCQEEYSNQVSPRFWVQGLVFRV